jgi:hypothetical protein
MYLNLITGFLIAESH